MPTIFGEKFRLSLLVPLGPAEEIGNNYAGGRLRFGIRDCALQGIWVSPLQLSGRKMVERASNSRVSFELIPGFQGPSTPSPGSSRIIRPVHVAADPS